MALELSKWDRLYLGDDPDGDLELAKLIIASEVFGPPLTPRPLLTDQEFGDTAGLVKTAKDTQRDLIWKVPLSRLMPEFKPSQVRCIVDGVLLPRKGWNRIPECAVLFPDNPKIEDIRSACVEVGLSTIELTRESASLPGTIRCASVRQPSRCKGILTPLECEVLELLRQEKYERAALYPPTLLGQATGRVEEYGRRVYVSFEVHVGAVLRRNPAFPAKLWKRIPKAFDLELALGNRGLDFVVLDRNPAGQPRFAVEVDSKFHDNPERQVKDRTKDLLFEIARLPLVRVRWRELAPRRIGGRDIGKGESWALLIQALDVEIAASSAYGLGNDPVDAARRRAIARAIGVEGNSVENLDFYALERILAAGDNAANSTNGEVKFKSFNSFLQFEDSRFKPSEDTSTRRQWVEMLGGPPMTQIDELVWKLPREYFEALVDCQVSLRKVGFRLVAFGFDRSDKGCQVELGVRAPWGACSFLRTDSFRLSCANSEVDVEQVGWRAATYQAIQMLKGFADSQSFDVVD